MRAIADSKPDGIRTTASNRRAQISLSRARSQEVAPDPGALIESMRAFVYSLPTAIADLVDNSITAGAREIAIDHGWEGDDSWISVVDDGCGMGEDALIAAMRL